MNMTEDRQFAAEALRRHETASAEMEVLDTARKSLALGARLAAEEATAWLAAHRSKFRRDDDGVTPVLESDVTFEQRGAAFAMLVGAHRILADLRATNPLTPPPVVNVTNVVNGVS